MFVNDESNSVGSHWSALTEVARQSHSAFFFGRQSDFDLEKNFLGAASEYFNSILPKVGLKILMGVPQRSTEKEALELLHLSKVPVEIPIENSSFYSIDDDISSLHDSEHDNSDLSWFDFGQEGMVKGTALMVSAETRRNWQPREAIPRFENTVVEGLELAKWLNNQSKLTSS